MKTFTNEEITDEIIYTVGDIITKIPTGYPHLDTEGDTWGLGDKDGNKIADCVVVNTHAKNDKDFSAPAFWVDIQIVKSLSAERVLENKKARCKLHDKQFPCTKCYELSVNNYLPAHLIPKLVKRDFYKFVKAQSN